MFREQISYNILIYNMNINKNGCQSKPSLNQILGIILFVANTVFTFIQVIILDEKIELIILSLLVVISSIFALITTLSVPTDLSVIKQMQFKIQGQAFDYEQQQLDQFCETCEAYVMTDTKHCKQYVVKNLIIIANGQIIVQEAQIIGNLLE
ncbi:hypothetical protein pb186bvf_013604 [Paramecium bursaria]